MTSKINCYLTLGDQNDKQRINDKNEQCDLEKDKLLLLCLDGLASKTDFKSKNIR